MQQKFDEFPIIKGAKVRYEGSVCEIDSFLSLDQLLLKSVESGRVFSAKIANIKPLNNVEFKSSGIKTDLSYLDCSIDWEGAKKREMIIAELAMKGCPRKKAKEAARELNISDRRVYKLVDKYRRSGFKLTSLIPLTSQGGKGKGRITTTIEQIIAATINELYLSKQKHKASYVIQEIKRRCHVAGLKPPSKNTIRSRIERLSEYEKKKKREGENAAKQFTPVYGSFPEPEYPLAVFQIDHTKVDLIVVDELYRQPIGRPYLTIAIDAFSRCIAGFCLTLEAPSATSVGLCLTHAVFEKDYWLISKNIKTSWPIWGKPGGIYVDNAQEFHSEALQRGCDLHGIKIEFRPKGQPHFGGIVERVIGTMMQLIHNLPGTTFSNIGERGEYNSDKKAVLTLAELERWLTIAITDYYHKKVHSSIKMSPIEKYKQGVLGDEMHSGRGYPAKIANRKAFLIDFLPLERRCLQRQGFVLDHITYYSNSLSPLIADRKKYGQFIIRRDPGDLSKIYVLDPTGNFYQEVHYSTLYRPTITLWEYRNAIRKLQELGISQVDESKIFDTVEMLRGIVKEAAKKTKSVRKDIERTRHAKSHREYLNLLSDKTNEININDDFAVDEDSSKNNDDYKSAKQEIRRFQDIEIWKD